jgi:16S rRNA (uracil1498-N3)-methyltransferase
LEPSYIRPPDVQFPQPMAHQLQHVLRQTKGSHIWVCDNTGWAYWVLITELNARSGQGRIIEHRFAENEPDCELTLYAALIKPDKFEWLLQKCTEIGVRRIVPLRTLHTAVSPQIYSPQRKARWQAICREASEQCQRSFVPELGDLRSVTEILPQFATFERVWLCWEEPNAGKIGSQDLGNHPKLALLIGPEGGWHVSEVEVLQSAGAKPVGLGKRILRAETAAAVACFAALQGF